MENRLSDRQINEIEERFRSLQKILMNDFNALLQEVKKLRQQIAKQEAIMMQKPVPEELAQFSEALINELPAVLKVNDIYQFLKIGRGQAYDLVKSGQFKYLKVGKRILISREVFIKWFLENR